MKEAPESIQPRPPFAAGNGFDPEAVEELHKAYTAVCNALHIFSGDRFGNEAVATRVIDLAITTGVLDATALRDRVLLEAQLATLFEPGPPYGSSSVAAPSFVIYEAALIVPRKRADRRPSL